MEPGKSRSANLTNAERQLIVELVTKYRDIVENKKTDHLTNAEKEAAWCSVSSEFNAVNSIKRDIKQLKQAYDNIKKKAKKVAANEKVERFRTGGGCHVPKTDPTDDQVLALLGNRAQPLVNPFDSDAAYNASVLSVGGDKESIEVDTACLLLPHDHSSPLIAANQPVEVICCVSQPQPSEVARSSGTWAGKRRSRPTSVAAVRNDVASHISSTAELQTQFYAATLEMARERHAAKMRVLHLKEELLRKKLSEEE